MERTGWFECSDPLREPAARERRVEHARQLPRHPHRLPAARRAARLDRRHPGVRADRVVPLRRRGDALRPGCATSPPSSCPTARSPGTSRSSRRTRCGRRSAPARPGATSRRSRRGRSTSASATPASCAAQYDSMRALGRPRASGSPGPDRLWDDGLPVRRLARPGRAAAGPGRRRAPTATSSPPPTSRGRRRTGRADGRGARAAPTTQTRYAALADEVATAFAAEYVLPDGRMTSDAQTAYALAIAFDLLPDADAARAAGRRGWPSWSREARLPHRHRLRRHAARLRRALRDRARSTTAYDLLLEQRVPVVALPGDDGRDDDLGALGQPAARRHGQPRRR